MDIPAGEAVVDAPWGINPATGRPYTKSPEERAQIGANLATARQRKAAARQAQAAADAPDPEQLPPIDRSTPDREPGPRPRRRGGRRRLTGPVSKPPPVDVPPFKAGPIAKGMNRIYAKAGRLLKVMGQKPLGAAFIAMTRKESDDDETVGEAWEALAQVSPVWRARLLKVCSGGAAGRVLIAHLPILLAVLAMEPVKKRMPFGGIVDAVFGDDDEPTGPDGTAEPSFEQMMAMATQMMGPMMMQRAAANAGPRTPAPDDVAGAYAFTVPIPDEMAT